LGAYAGVGAEAEGEVAGGGGPGDVERVGTRVTGGVPVGRTEGDEHVGTGREFGAGEGDRAGRDPAEALERAVVAGRLLHGRRDQLRSPAQQLPLVPVAQQVQDGGADQRGGGQVPGDQQVLQVGDGLVTLFQGEFGVAGAGHGGDDLRGQVLARVGV